MNNVFATEVIDQKGMSFEMPEFIVFDSAIVLVAGTLPSSCHISPKSLLNCHKKIFSMGCLLPFFRAKYFHLLLMKLLSFRANI